MALTDENGSGMVMPVGPLYGNGSGDGLFGGNSGWWIILLFVLLGGWGNGFGGFGGGFNGAGELYPWMNQSNQINNGFRDQMLGTQLNGIQQGITSGFGDVQTALCAGFAGINQQITNNQIADLERSFSAQTASTAGMNALQAQMAQCCCDNRAGLADLRYTVATEACADRNAISDALKDVLAANTASTQRILDQMCQDKIDQKNDTINQLRSELLYARGQASQDVQTAQIIANNNAQTNALEQYLAPIPRPAYIVQNPNCCQQTTCGCGTGCGI